MNQKQPLTTGNKLVAIGLVLFGLSIPVQISMGVTAYPVVPPGLFITVAVAALIFFGRWRWAIMAGVLLSCILLIGTFASGWIPKVVDPSSIGYPAILSQMLGLVIALVGSAMSTVELYKIYKK
jgi:hypothetical protein